MTESIRRLFARALSDRLHKSYGPVKELTGDSRLSTYYCYFLAQGRAFTSVNDFEEPTVMGGLLTFGLLFHSFYCQPTDTLTILIPARVDPLSRIVSGD